MKIKVNYNELNSKSKELEEEANDLERELDKLITYLSDVGNSWQGENSEIFIGNASDYYNSAKEVVMSIKAFSSFVNNANKNYYNSDVKWKNDVEKVGAEFGRNEKKLFN